MPSADPVDRPDDPMLSCTGKKRYSTEANANTVAADCFRARGHWLRVYACEHCRGFHLTHSQAAPKPGWRPPARSQRAETFQERDERARRMRRRRERRG